MRKAHAILQIFLKVEVRIANDHTQSGKLTRKRVVLPKRKNAMKTLSIRGFLLGAILAAIAASVKVIFLTKD